MPVDVAAQPNFKRFGPTPEMLPESMMANTHPFQLQNPRQSFIASTSRLVSLRMRPI